ncbi:4-hydroxy-tetrahydrodipicolinate reductase [Buchnera aphidicola]|uniref:4-hydroxy-tetrahydrodipicolinate reductase n=1 Tax=Buchnera aphidicola TaxID=9 RepID=UPI003BEEE6DD
MNKIKPKKIRIAIAGALGRMGKYLIKEVQENKYTTLSAAFVSKNHPLINKDIGEIIGIGKIGILISDELHEKINTFDVLIDFTKPSSTFKYLKYCSLFKKNIIIGTTGFSTEEMKKISQYSSDIAIMISANFSIGINLLLQLIKKTTEIIGHQSDIEIIESHHRNKIDAPSGTALSIGETISKVMNWDLKKHSIYSREKIKNVREKNKIGFSTIRAGDIIGKHTVMYASPGEQINITHTASNRKAFSTGAIQAAIWIYNKKIGLFNMNDVLSF